jgi:RNA polymerase sigma-70 factor (ECF subfamily)
MMGIVDQRSHQPVGPKAKIKPPVGDSELLSRHLEGDPQAFAELVERYRQELFGFLTRFLGDATTAEDVFQETFLQLHISAGTFDLSRRLKPWLFTIAANKARDSMRSRARRQTAPLDAPISGAQGEGSTYADLIPSGIPSPVEDVANLETRQAVQSIVKRMPENLRMVLLLGYFQELPYKEIADILDVPLGTVKSRLHAAVKHFARQWKSAARKSEHD